MKGESRPGAEHDSGWIAEFVGGNDTGNVHKVRDPPGHLADRDRSELFFAGQVSGVEGYESRRRPADCGAKRRRGARRCGSRRIERPRSAPRAYVRSGTSHYQRQITLGTSAVGIARRRADSRTRRASGQSRTGAWMREPHGRNDRRTGLRDLRGSSVSSITARVAATVSGRHDVTQFLSPSARDGRPARELS